MGICFFYFNYLILLKNKIVIFHSLISLALNSLNWANYKPVHTYVHTHTHTPFRRKGSISFKKKLKTCFWAITRTTNSKV